MVSNFRGASLEGMGEISGRQRNGNERLAGIEKEKKNVGVAGEGRVYGPYIIT